MPWFLGNSSMMFFDWRGYILPLLLWSTVWKGLALWHAARRGEKWWFVAVLLINTAGILEIFYLVFVVHAFFRSYKYPIQKKSLSRKR